MPSAGLRFVCYCKDCQAFARFLRRTDVLDPAGGTDIFQMPAGRVRLTAGMDAVDCLRLSDRVFRWYAACCGTPIANTAGPRFPVVALIHSFMALAGEGRARNEALGPLRCRIFDHSAAGPLPPGAPAPPSLGLRALRLWWILQWWVRGLGRPHPFFDDRTNAPLRAPRVFASSERAALDRVERTSR